MKKIAILGSMHSDGYKIFEAAGFDFFEVKDFKTEILTKSIEHVDGIAIRTVKLNADILKKCKNLKIVARHGVGYDNIDINFLNEKKIPLAITGTANAISVAEHVMTMFLYLSKRINIAHKLVKNNDFDKRNSLPDFFEIFEKNILILGFGRIGKIVAKRCLGFDSKVYVYDPFVSKKIIEENNCISIDFKEGIKIADFITIHMPLNNKTTNLITRKQFLKMKSNCIIVNTARGGIINEDDLIWALENKVIYGAGLDVYKYEPPKLNSKIFNFDNILLTPHNAALTLECRKRMSVETCENITLFLNQSSKLNVSNIVNKSLINLNV